MKKIAEKTVKISADIPAELYARLVQQVGKETSDRGCTITTSKIVRWAIEDYLDQWETATFVPDPVQKN